MHARTHTHTRMHACMCAHAHTYIHTHAQTNVSTKHITSHTYPSQPGYTVHINNLRSWHLDVKATFKQTYILYTKIVLRTGQTRTMPIVLWTGLTRTMPIVLWTGLTRTMPIVLWTGQTRTMPIVLWTGLTWTMPIVLWTGLTWTMPIVLWTGLTRTMPMKQSWFGVTWEALSTSSFSIRPTSPCLSDLLRPLEKSKVNGETGVCVLMWWGLGSLCLCAVMGAYGTYKSASSKSWVR